MERYGKEVRCPKCGGSLSARRYNAVSDILEAKCWNCGYQQDMLPLDREEKPHVCGECRAWRNAVVFDGEHRRCPHPHFADVNAFVRAERGACGHFVPVADGKGE